MVTLERFVGIKVSPGVLDCNYNSSYHHVRSVFAIKRI